MYVYLFAFNQNYCEGKLTSEKRVSSVMDIVDIQQIKMLYEIFFVKDKTNNSRC